MGRFAGRSPEMSGLHPGLSGDQSAQRPCRSSRFPRPVPMRGKRVLKGMKRKGCSLFSTFVPTFSRQQRVDVQSAPSEKLWTVIPFEETAPSRAARWDMDLSPGSETIPVIFLPVESAHFFHALFWKF